MLICWGQGSKMNNLFVSLLYLIISFSATLVIYKRFGKFGLYSWMCLLVVICNIQTIKLSEIFGLTISLGNISYGALFLTTDIISEKYGRLHTIYLTDEKGIDYWVNALQTDNYTLYRVEASGEIFKTNEQLIPEEMLSYKDVYESAYNYWHPNFKHVPDYTNEYLVKGKVKVLEKIK